MLAGVVSGVRRILVLITKAEKGVVTMTGETASASGASYDLGQDGLAGHDLLRTIGGQRLHIAPCPHLLGVTPREATAAERAVMQLCYWCDKEVSGHGRTYYDSLESAMRAFGNHVDTVSLIRSHLRSVPWDQIWIPNSRSYLALGLGGRGVAWVGKGYVVPRRGEFVTLPGFVGSGRGGGTPTVAAWGETCAGCFMQRSVSGACGCE
jgi:hypothetical protein